MGADATPPPGSAPDLHWQSRFVAASSGLRLHARFIGDPASRAVPVVCLAGLSRHSEDFERIGLHLAREAGRFVLALDSRGRGRSDFDPDWRRYDLAVELEDVFQVLAAFGLSRVIILGTSRGGLLAGLTAMVAPDLLAGVILNDIGPVIETRGLARIRSYIGKLPKPENYPAAVSALKQIFGAHFRALDDEAWMRFAKRSFRESDGGLVPTYDPNLMKTLESLDFEAPMPDLSPQFAALDCAPLLVIRGELSDLLADSTAREMVARHPDARLHIVPDQGHAPLLEDAPTMHAILDFVCRIP
jgi:pimeloyl-ACP methyl ester carboxylesterase